MDIRRKLRHLVKGLAVCTLAYASTGCAQVSNRFWADRIQPARTPTGIDRQKPASDISKPADATGDSEDRHPSRWRQKLRVRYS
jgi:hypothetical protein